MTTKRHTALVNCPGSENNTIIRVPVTEAGGDPSRSRGAAPMAMADLIIEQFKAETAALDLDGDTGAIDRACQVVDGGRRWAQGEKKTTLTHDAGGRRRRTSSPQKGS